MVPTITAPEFDIVVEYTVLPADGPAETVTLSEVGFVDWAIERFGSARPELRFLGREDNTRRVWGVYTNHREPKALVWIGETLARYADGHTTVLANAR